MAGRDHNYTRRAVLGAAFAVPALGAAQGPGAAALADAKWRRALADLERAEAEMDDFCRGCRAGILVFRDQCELDDRFGDHLGAFYAALGRLLRAPAPHFEALAVKIALAVDHEVATLTGGEACLAALKAGAGGLPRRYPLIPTTLCTKSVDHGR
jgi:hypothetical protein